MPKTKQKQLDGIFSFSKHLSNNLAKLIHGVHDSGQLGNFNEFQKMPESQETKIKLYPFFFKAGKLGIN